MIFIFLISILSFNPNTGVNSMNFSCSIISIHGCIFYKTIISHVISKCSQSNFFGLSLRPLLQTPSTPTTCLTCTIKFLLVLKTHCFLNAKALCWHLQANSRILFLPAEGKLDSQKENFK